MTNRSYFSGILLSVIIFFSACKESTREERLENLPNSVGKPNEIMLIMDSSLYSTVLGDSLRATFASNIPGLPRPEARYNLKRVQPEQLSRFIKTHTNLIFVTSFSDRSRGGRITQEYFTDEEREKMKTDPSRHMLLHKDAFAKNQTMIHLYGENAESLAKYVSENKRMLLNLFDEKEREAMKRMVYGSGYQKDISQKLYDNHGFWIKVPNQYQVAKDTIGFVWLRKIGQEVDRSLIIAYEEYLSEEQFNPIIIDDRRDELGRHHIFGSGTRDTTSYMMRQSYLPSQTEQVSFNGNYAIRTQGLWKLKNISMGGPYIGYTVLDTIGNRVYYLEGFVYSPGRDQRDFMLELDVELHSFSTAPPNTVAAN